MTSTKKPILQRLTKENQISRFNSLPLKDIAVRRLAILLCSNFHMLSFVSDLNILEGRNTDASRESEVKSHVLELILPDLSLDEATNQRLLQLMKPLCREIAKWINFHQKFCGADKFHDLMVLINLCWTPIGTIDYRKTADKLIRYDLLDIENRYMLACLYCFHSGVKVLFKKLPESSKIKQFWEKRVYDPDQSDFLRAKNCYWPRIVDFWMYILRVEDKFKQLIPNIRFRRQTPINHIKSNAIEGYKDTTEFFLSLLPSEKRQPFLVPLVQCVAEKRKFDFCSYKHEYQKFSDVIFYLFSLMSENQVEEVLQTHAFEILKCCLDWPRQEYFVDVAKLAFEYLQEEDYCRLLFILSSNINWGYDYRTIYREFFRVSPGKFREYSLKNYGYFMKVLFHSEDIEDVKFIFRHLDGNEKSALVVSQSMVSCFLSLMHSNRLDWVELCLRDVILSQTEKDKLLSDFGISYKPITYKEYLIFKKFEALVNSNIASSSKCDETTKRMIRLTIDFPDIDPEENPSKKPKMDMET